MSLRKLFIVFCMVGIFGGIGLTAGPGSAAADNILKIGAIWGLSGPGSHLGIIMKEGSDLAEEWINKDGGITVDGKKYKIELLTEDNKNSAQGSAGAATKLVHRDGVKFIIGMNVPFQIEAVQSVTEKNKVLLVAAKLSKMKPEDKFTFSGTQGFTVPIPGLYDLLQKAYPDVKTVAYSAHDEPGALATCKVATMEAEKRGLKTFEPVLTQFGTKEYYPAWTKIMKNKPDAVDIGISFPDALAANVRQGRELGFEGPIVSMGTGAVLTFTELIGKEMATDFIFAGFDIHSANNPPMVKKIIQLWNKKYKKPFNPDALDAWSALWTLTQAIEKAQSFDPAVVVKTWEKMKTIETPWGTGSMGGAKVFGVNHMVLAPAPICRLKNGKVDTIQWYKPVLP